MNRILLQIESLLVNIASAIPMVTTVSFAVAQLPSALAQDPPVIEFRKIAGSDTPVPGGDGNFLVFGDSAIDKGNVVFQGRDASSNLVLFLWDGKLSRIADFTTKPPERGVAFKLLLAPHIAGSYVSYVGTGEDDITGWYTQTFDGELVEIASTATIDPRPTLRGPVVVDSVGDAVFYTRTQSIDRIFQYREGIVSTLVETGMEIPGGGTFDLFASDIVYDEGNTGLRGTDKDGDWGVYKIVGDREIRVVAKTGLSIPGQMDKSFSTFVDVSIAGESVAFAASDGTSPRIGVYSDFGGLHRIADTTTMGADGQFLRALSAPLIDNDLVVFTAIGRYSGLYGSIRRGEPFPILISTQTEIDGKRVLEFKYGNQGMDDGQVSVEIRFLDGSLGMYIIDIDRGKPIEPDPAPQISSVTVSNGMIILSWESFNAEGNYAVETSDDLLSWKRLTVLEATTFQDSMPNSTTYYRISTP